MMSAMGTTTAIPVEEYLRTDYDDGDREYVDGEVVERNVGERSHAWIQGLIHNYLRQQYKKYWSAPEARVRLGARLYRVPDVCLLIGTWPVLSETGPITQIPFLVVEILSPEDRAGMVQEKIDDYLNAGVKYVWVVNPYTKRGYIYTADGSHEAKDGVLRTENPAIKVPLKKIFE